MNRLPCWETGEGAWIVSGRLDNLAMAHAVLDSMPQPGIPGDSSILALWFDAEEIGSRTVAGAASLFLDEMIERIVLAAGGGREEVLRNPAGFRHGQCRYGPCAASQSCFKA